MEECYQDTILDLLASPPSGGRGAVPFEVRVDKGLVDS